jgi:hypothetical protein
MHLQRARREAHKERDRRVDDDARVRTVGSLSVCDVCQNENT